MRKIGVGMLVRVIENGTAEIMRHHIGHIGRVVSQCPQHNDAWFIDGARYTSTGQRCSFCSDELQPIDPPKTTTWEHVADDTGWNPTKQPTAA